MNCFEYVWIYLIYTLLIILGGVIWLKNTNSPYGNSLRFVHHYQIGLVMLVLSIPLIIFVFITDDTLGRFMLICYLFLGFISLLFDWNDFLIGIRNFEERIGWKLEEDEEK